ncbi:alpha-N-acetylgalactosaminide alpha-2,6-sialyltransferase 2 isoform X2 [Scleropages formosus]|uniref:alpha-N-acetylgalactosaminide alpha-2,6-sialyltransferase 2 isoform X2 n=1 Tax=Scleropages formosus TaxID=113540 RepID=UPI0008784A05|nr:alpha-N-acetylgalactosaminide alpha-2,6-sialyltransferase 2 isoform X2 [Scleropages formosus]
MRILGFSVSMRTFSRICVFLVLGVSAASLITFICGHYCVNFVSSGRGAYPARLRQLVLTRDYSFQFVDHEKRIRGQSKERPLCSLRWMVEKDVVLRQYFNFSVPVLMWATDLHPSVWHRLQNHWPPYGWKGLPPNVVNATLTLLKDSSGLLFDRGSLHCVRCAVVGNGGILKGSKQGKAINSHHFVFRVNGAITKGFEEDVGTKTNFYGFTTNTMKNSLLSYQAAGFNKVPQGQDVHYVFIPADIRDYEMLKAGVKGIPVISGVDEGDEPSRYFGHSPALQKFKMLHPDFVTYIKERFLKSPLLESMFPNLYMPSTGALMLMTALHTCDKVSAYGFITKNYQNFSDHYFDKVKQPLVFYANHDMLMESRLWADLHAREVMWLYTRP